MKTFLPSILLFCGLFLAGCMPVERIWWSPEGDRAVVVLDEVPHLVNHEGEILKRLSLEDAEASETRIDGIEWLPDGKRFIAHRVCGFEGWAKARRHLAEEEAERIEQLATAIPNLLASSILVEGDTERPEGLLDRFPGSDANLLWNAFVLALETQPDAVENVLSGAPRSLAALKETQGETERFLVHEIVLVDLGDGVGERIEILLGSSEAIQFPTVSPQGDSVAFVRKSGGGNLFSIEICPIAGGSPVRRVDGVHDTISWTEEGRSIVFMSPVAKEGVLKQFKKITIFDDSGNRLDRKSRITMNLAAAVVPFAPRIERLPGNRFLIASQSGSFPVTSSETPYEAHLYRVSAEDGTIERIPTSPGALPMNLGFFVASPDGKSVAIVESDTDAVAVVDIETGHTELVSPANADWRCRTLPSWKNNDDLTFAALNESTEVVQWKVRRAEQEVRILNRGLPAEATADWLEKKEEP